MTTRMTAQRLSRLIASGDAAAVRTAVAEQPGLLGHTVERGGSNGWTPLHVAVAENQPAIVDVLLTAGADVTARTEHAAPRCTSHCSSHPTWSAGCARRGPSSTRPAPPTWTTSRNSAGNSTPARRSPTR
jgi:ankyrin repeat protein